MFFIVDDSKSLLKPKYSVVQSSVMMHPYKWALAEVFPGKNVFSIVDPSFNKFWKVHWILSGHSRKKRKDSLETRIIDIFT